MAVQTENGMQTIVTGNAVADARVFGAVATRLNDALGRARQALEPHTPLLPDGLLSDLDGVLAEFARRRVRIALHGEVKAGKSTLLNALAGAALSPVAFEPLTSVPVRVTYGARTLWRVGTRELGSVAELETLMRDGMNGIPEDLRSASIGSVTLRRDRSPSDRFSVPSPTGCEAVVETDLDLLELGGQVDLLDTPGVGSTDDFDAISAEALRALDAVILVVRYPALFTQFTRRLMESLDADIGKLFVVWNLDADCADLSAEERTRHAETLRANVAGAHDLFLVDARAAFRAMQTEDGAASVSSGLTSLIAALRRFASSGGREVAALRETAKRARVLLESAQRCLTLRRTTLEGELSSARTRLERVRATAAADSAAARAELATLEATLAQIGEQGAAKARGLAAGARRDLRSARRRWIRRGDIGALETAVSAALNRYADAAHAAAHDTCAALKSAAGTFGTEVAVSERPRCVPGTVNRHETTAPRREPGNEFPGSVDQSRLKSTAAALSESPSGDFSSTQPGNSFPSVDAARTSEQSRAFPPTTIELAPAARSTLATSGGWQLLRRAVWQRWYLPGLTALERTGIGDELNAHTSWLKASVAAARTAAAATLTAKLTAIARHADTETAQIKTDTNFDANEAECVQLGTHVPIVTAQTDAIVQLNQEARALLRGT